MGGAGLKVVLALGVGAASAAGVFLVLEHGGTLRDRLFGTDTRWVEYSCRGSKEVSELIGAERIAHARQEVTERIFLDARSINLDRSDGARSVIVDFTRDETMAEWRQSTQEAGDESHRHTVSTVGTLFFRTETLVIRDIETVSSGGWDHQWSSLLSAACHVVREGRY